MIASENFGMVGQDNLARCHECGTRAEAPALQPLLHGLARIGDEEDVGARSRYVCGMSWFVKPDHDVGSVDDLARTGFDGAVADDGYASAQRRLPCRDWRARSASL